MMSTQNGFTLIELLVVVAIIGILATILVTQTVQHRAAAQCAKVESDVRNATTTLEAAFAKNENYNAVVLISSPSVSLSSTASGATIGTTTGTHPACREGTFTFFGSTGKYSWVSAS
jgi:type IV pilus assembly protein PilA